MKSERRHELQHNELADWLIKSGEALKPYQNVVMAAVAAAVVAMVGYTIWSRQAASTATQAWDDTAIIINSGNVPKLTTVIENYPNTEAAHMASLVLGDYYLSEGCNRLFVNKATAQTDLKKAIDAYQPILEQATEPAFHERATFGLARAKEARGQAEDLKQAQQLYSDVVSKWPEGAFAVAARQRLEDLKRPETMRVYERFAKFDPKPAFSSEPLERPSFDTNSLPSEAPANIPATSYDLNLGGKDTDKSKASEIPKPVDVPGKK